MTVTPLGWDQDCSLKIREPEVPAPFWFLDPGGWSKTAAVGLYFIFPGICTLSLNDDFSYLSGRSGFKQDNADLFIVELKEGPAIMGGAIHGLLVLDAIKKQAEQAMVNEINKSTLSFNQKILFLHYMAPFCISGYFGTHHIDQAALKITNIYLGLPMEFWDDGVYTTTAPESHIF
ncbi:hypothetical protein STEG23_028658 [Scotinomys teguina]